MSSALSNPNRDGDYRLLVATTEDNTTVVGYVCHGPTPMTESAWDLYWIATDQDYRRKGIGSALLRAMETEIKGLQGNLIRVETSTTDGYGEAHRFYALHGYPEICRIANFYKPGDDLILLAKYL